MYGIQETIKTRVMITLQWLHIVYGKIRHLKYHKVTGFIISNTIINIETILVCP